MGKHRCNECSFRKKYDNKPKSIGGRLWRWHINWCPGWKKYYGSLDEKEKLEIELRYNFKK